MEHISLNHLPPGKIGKIEYLKDNESKRRLLELGLIPNTKIKTERYSPSGDPIAFNIRGAIIAIRKDDAQNILIYKV